MKSGLEKESLSNPWTPNLQLDRFHISGARHSGPGITNTLTNSGVPREGACESASRKKCNARVVPFIEFGSGCGDPRTWTTTGIDFLAPEPVLEEKGATSNRHESIAPQSRRFINGRIMPHLVRGPARLRRPCGIRSRMVRRQFRQRRHRDRPHHD